MKRSVIFFLLLIYSLSFSLYSQNSTIPEKELEIRINRALDYFGEGNYEEAIAVLENVLAVDPENERASDLLISIKELYEMEKGTSSSEEENSIETQRPDFSINPSIEEPEVSEPEEELEKPDFSIRDDDENLILPEETRTFLEFSLFPSLVHSWSIGEDAVVFPAEGSYSGSINVSGEYYFPFLDRIIGAAGGYTLFMLDPDWGDFPDGLLHVLDGMISFRTFFLEEIDKRIIFELSAGYRGYFSQGYEFYDIQENSLHSFNMGVNLEGPFLYQFINREPLKNIIFDVQMNLLFFPEISTLNLFDFRGNVLFQLNHFSIGVHFGAYSVITAEDVKYIWMNGINFNLQY